jgi:hypothetical protein
MYHIYYFEVHYNFHNNFYYFNFVCRHCFSLFAISLLIYSYNFDYLIGYHNFYYRNMIVDYLFYYFKIYIYIIFIYTLYYLYLYLHYIYIYYISFLYFIYFHLFSIMHSILVYRTIIQSIFLHLPL